MIGVVVAGQDQVVGDMAHRKTWRQKMTSRSLVQDVSQDPDEVAIETTRHMPPKLYL